MQVTFEGAPATIDPNSVPVCFTVSAEASCGAQILEGGIDVSAWFINGQAKQIDKQYSGEWTVNGNEICITDSGGVGTWFEISAWVVDDAGRQTEESLRIDVLKPGRQK